MAYILNKIEPLCDKHNDRGFASIEDTDQPLFTCGNLRPLASNLVHRVDSDQIGDYPRLV